MGFFEGANDLLKGSGGKGDPQVILPVEKIGVGHVLSTISSFSDSDYDPSKNVNIGTIFFRDAFAAGGESSREEGNKRRYAAPLDRANYKLPIPGEQVMIYRARSSKLDGPDDTSFLFYGSVVNMSSNITSNTAPYIGISPKDVVSSILNPGSQLFSELNNRFDKKIKNLIAFRDPASLQPIVHKQLLPNEGDFILQGRFGGSIRFTGTPTDEYVNDQLWAEGRVGKVGDPITILRVSNAVVGDKTKVATESYDVEDINTDAASIYMTTTQQIGVDLAVPDKGDKIHPLASWAYTYGIEFNTSIDKAASNLKDGEEARQGKDKKADKQVNSDTQFE